MSFQAEAAKNIVVHIHANLALKVVKINPKRKAADPENSTGNEPANDGAAASVYRSVQLFLIVLGLQFIGHFNVVVVFIFSSQGYYLIGCGI